MPPFKFENLTRVFKKPAEKPKDLQEPLADNAKETKESQLLTKQKQWLVYVLREKLSQPDQSIDAATLRTELKKNYVSDVMYFDQAIDELKQSGLITQEGDNLKLKIEEITKLKPEQEKKWHGAEVSQEEVNNYIEKHEDVLLGQLSTSNNFNYYIPDLSALDLAPGQMLKIDLLHEAAKKYSQEKQIIPLQLKFSEAIKPDGDIDWHACWKNQIKSQLKQIIPEQDYNDICSDLSQKKEIDSDDLFDAIQEIQDKNNYSLRIFSQDAFGLGLGGQSNLRSLITQKESVEGYFLVDLSKDKLTFSESRTSPLLNVAREDESIIDIYQDKEIKLQNRFEFGGLIHDYEADKQTQNFINETKNKILQNKALTLIAPRRAGTSSILNQELELFNEANQESLYVDMSDTGALEKIQQRIKQYKNQDKDIILLLDEVDITDLDALGAIEKIAQETPRIHLVLRLPTTPERLKSDYPEAYEIIAKITENQSENNLTTPYRLNAEGSQNLIGKFWEGEEKFDEAVYRQIRDYTGDWGYFIQHLCANVLQESEISAAKINTDLVDKTAQKILTEININQTLDNYWQQYLSRESQWAVWGMAQAIKKNNKDTVSKKQINQILKEHLIQMQNDLDKGLEQLTAEGIIDKKGSKYQFKMKLFQIWLIQTFKFSEKFIKPKQEAGTEKIKEIVEKQREFLEKGGIVFDEEFKKLEKQDTRKYKVVFDLDGVLRDQHDPDIIRPGAIELIEKLRDKNIKIIIWTSAHRVSAKQSEIPHDILITLENYSTRFLDKMKFQDEIDYQGGMLNGLGGAIKDIKRLGYSILLDDNYGAINKLKEDKCQATYVNTYDTDNRYMQDPLSEDLEKQILKALNYKPNQKS